MQEIKSLFLLLLFLVCSRFEINAFETTSESESEFSRNLSSSGGDVSLFTGSAVLDIPLATITEGANLSFPVSLHYSSNVYRTVRADNAISPTDWVGLGWALGWGSIICNHNNTASHDDDQFFWKTSEGYTLEIRKGNNEYYIENKPYLKIKPTYNTGSSTGIITGWTIIEPNGHKMLFGNFSDNTIKATRYTYKWDWYVGDVRLLQRPNVEPTLYPYQWDLSEMRDFIGNSIRFKYDQKTEGLHINTCASPPDDGCEWQITDPALFYTKSSWPLSIESSTGGKVLFETSEKDAEEYIDPYTFSSEPDEYIEFFNTKLLTKVSVYSSDNNLLKYFNLTYSKINGALSGNYKKSLLTGVKEFNAGGTLFKSSKFDYYDNFEKGDDQNSTMYDPDYNYGALKSTRTNAGAAVTYYYKKKLIPFEAIKHLTFSGLGEMKVSVGMRSNSLPYVCATNHSKLYVYNWNGSKWSQQTAIPETFFGGGTIDSVLATTDMFVICGDGGKYYIYNWVRGEWYQSASRTTDIAGFKKIMIAKNIVGIEKNGSIGVYRAIELHTWDRCSWHEKNIEYYYNGASSGNTMVVGANIVGYTEVDWELKKAYVNRWMGYGNEWTDGSLLHTNSSMIYVIPMKNFCYSVTSTQVRINQWQGTAWDYKWIKGYADRLYEEYTVSTTTDGGHFHAWSATWNGKVFVKQEMSTEMSGVDFKIMPAKEYFLIIPKSSGTKRSYVFNWNKVSHQWDEKNGFNVVVSNDAEVMVYDNMYVLADVNNTSRTFYTYTWNGKSWKEQVFTDFVPANIGSAAGVGNALAFGYNDGVTLLYKYRDKFSKNYEMYCTEKVVQADVCTGKSIGKTMAYALSNGNRLSNTRSAQSRSIYTSRGINKRESFFCGISEQMGKAVSFQGVSHRYVP